MRAIATDPVIRKLNAVTLLTDTDLQWLALSLGPLEPVPAHHDIMSEGSLPGGTIVVMAGFACRHKSLRSGRRQITDYLLPGDWCGPQGSRPRVLDYSVGTLSHCLIARISNEALVALFDNCPSIAQAVGWFELMNEAILREWLVNIGQRSADERIAHLFCEILVRLETVGMAAHQTCDFFPTQQDLAETTGLSVVHVNRVLQSLRNAGLIRLKNKSLTVLDWPRLSALANFSPTYLDLGRARRDP